MTRAYLGLGANIGNRTENLRAALRRLAARCEIAGVSSLYASKALVLEGQPPGPDYRNAVCAVDTELGHDELLAFAKEIEHALGRRPAERWAPRPIDIDLLLYGDEVIDTPDLRVPHPRMAERAFVLVPLAELAPDYVHPLSTHTIAELANAAADEGLERIAGPEWAAGVG